MNNEDFWHAYEALHAVDSLYMVRKPIGQLLWCLGYAQSTTKHLADTQALCKELGIPANDFFD